MDTLFVLNTTSLSVNLPSSGSVSITVVGTSFSSSDASISVRLRGSAVHSTVWKSHSSTGSKTSAGAMKSEIWQVSVGIQVATVASFVSFDIPEVLSTTDSEVPQSGSVTISLLGSGLVVFETSQRAAITTSCESSSLTQGQQGQAQWHEGSCVVCCC